MRMDTQCIEAVSKQTNKNSPRVLQMVQDSDAKSQHPLQELRPSMVSTRTSSSDIGHRPRKRFSRGSSLSSRQSASSGIPEQVFSWGIGLNLDEEVGIQPYPSETASSVLSLDVYSDLEPTHVPNEAEVDSSMTPSTHGHNSTACSCVLCVVWNIFSAYVAVMTVQFLGQLGVLLALLVLVPALSMGGRAGYRAFADFFHSQPLQTVTPGFAGDACMSPFSLQQPTSERRAPGILHYSRRFAVAVGMSSSLSGLACMFVGFALEFWWIRRWPIAIFMTLFSLPFVVTALMADGYVLMGCLGYSFSSSCDLNSLNLVHSWVDRLAQCVTQSLTLSNEPRQIIFLACQGIVFSGGIILTAIYGRKAFARLLGRAPVLVTSGLLVFLLSFCVYGLAIVFLLTKKCLGLVRDCICFDWGLGNGGDAARDTESVPPRNLDMVSPFEMETSSREMVDMDRASNIA